MNTVQIKYSKSKKSTIFGSSKTKGPNRNQNFQNRIKLLMPEVSERERERERERSE